MSDDKFYGKPFGGGLWRMRPCGSDEGGRLISFLPPNLYSHFGGDEIFELPEEGYEYRIVNGGEEGGTG